MTSPSSAAASPTDERRMKVIVVGKRYVGKTALVQRYVDDIFNRKDKATIGVDFFLKELLPKPSAANGGGKLLKLSSKSQAYHSEIPCRVMMHLWDIAGQETYVDQLSATFCRGAIAAVVVCDVTQPDSFDAARVLKRELNRMVTIPDVPGDIPVPTMLVVNKHDLVVGRNPESPAAMTDAQIAAFSQELGFDDWFFSSAKTGENINAVFDALVTRVFTDPRVASSSAFRPTDGGAARLKPKPPPPGPKCPCR